MNYDLGQADYARRVYSGVLGKLIGVYLGRPFEQWSHERIMRELGEIRYYVHTRRKVPLIVSDDDITGTFTFVRAMEDYGFSRDLSPAQIGHTWLNYIIENKTILWWGGMGMSTEHTAFIHLKRGMDAPVSGSVATNGATVAEQIGAQIFIDGWGMIAAGDPAYAADLAKRAGSVSHDGEALYAAQVMAAMEAAAFVESDLSKLLDIAVSFIPRTSQIFRLIDDLRAIRVRHDDWHVGLARIHEKYSYEIYDSNCHVVPNHAVIMLGLLWGNGNFDESMMITNTAGYDTDCNSGNVGCILGIRNGLEGINQTTDWRGPVADRLLLPTADGGSCINDALTVAMSLTNTGRRMRDLPPLRPKNGSRFHFSMPGSVQGFTVSPETPAAASLTNSAGTLRFQFNHLLQHLSARATTPTFLSEEQAKMGGYSVVATPSLYSGQKIQARMRAGHLLNARLVIRYYDEKDQLVAINSDVQSLSNSWTDIAWTCPDTGGLPIADIGIEVLGPSAGGWVELDFLHWSGTPTLTLKKMSSGTYWRRAWVEAGDGFTPWAQGSKFQVVQNEGRGLLITGTREWTDYQVRTVFRPNMVKEFGLAARVQGLGRYVAVLVGRDGRVRLVEVLHTERVLAEARLDWSFDTAQIEISMTVIGNQLTATVNQLPVLIGKFNPLLAGGGIAIVSEEGAMSFDRVEISPADSSAGNT